jgi:uncharacterized GH25 family protein
VRRRVYWTLALCAFAGVASAHDLYLMPDSFRVKAGTPIGLSMHNGDAFPESDGPPAIARLRDSLVVSAKGRVAMENVRAEEKRGRAEATAPAGGFVLMTRTIPNFIDLSPAKFHEYLEHEGLGWVVEWRKKSGEADQRGRELYSKHAKAIAHADGAGSVVTRPVGQPIEIVPLQDPATVKPGGTLRFQVLFQGKPAGVMAMAAASTAGGQTLTTDAQGRGTVTLKTGGPWKLHTIKMVRLEQREKADWESFWASLTFEIRP